MADLYISSELYQAAGLGSKAAQIHIRLLADWRMGSFEAHAPFPSGHAPKPAARASVEYMIERAESLIAPLPKEASFLSTGELHLRRQPRSGIPDRAARGNGPRCSTGKRPAPAHILRARYGRRSNRGCGFQPSILIEVPSDNSDTEI